MSRTCCRLRSRAACRRHCSYSSELWFFAEPKPSRRSATRIRLPLLRQLQTGSVESAASSVVWLWSRVLGWSLYREEFPCECWGPLPNAPQQSLKVGCHFGHLRRSFHSSFRGRNKSYGYQHGVIHFFRLRNLEQQSFSCFLEGWTFEDHHTVSSRAWLQPARCHLIILDRHWLGLDPPVFIF